MSVNSKIAAHIVRAQAASDGGKGKAYNWHNSQKAKTDNNAGYAHKDPAILAAINLINCCKSNWKYAVKNCYDYNRPAWTIYFETRIEGEKIQISFHSFNSTFSKYVNNSFRTKWDEKDSHESAIFAYKYYADKGKYV